MEGLSPEGLTTVNRELFRKIYRLFPDSGDRLITFKKGNELVEMGRILHPDEGREEEDFPLVPVTLSRPLVSFMIAHQGILVPVTTPYGILLDLCIGQDGRLCHFSNFYDFDRRGNGVKHEIVDPDTTDYGSPEEAILNVMGKEFVDQVPRLEFVPKEDDTRVVPLTIGIMK
ncbi:hypothetical protein HYU96_03040 [Candidatus Daviesbacteria bacterium]|nr:hypothetical protein [Candidatus Daviesbacteria bacterium]